MKKVFLMSVVGAVSLPMMVFAEGDGNKDWAEEAAQKYEQKAEVAAKSGDEKSAKIYKRMAQIKRDAGAAGKAGKEFSWDEYHKLNAELNGHGKDHDKGDKVHKEHKRGHGDGFLDAAKEYARKGAEAIKAGDADKAQIYLEMARIKRQASAANKAGKDFNWDRYHELNKRLHAGHPKHDKPHEHPGPKPAADKGSSHLE